MIFFVEAFEVLFILYTAVKSIAYGIYNIREKNIPGGVLVFTLTGVMLFLLGFSMYINV